MKRRDVIKLGAIAAGASVGTPGCGVPRMLSSLRGEDGAAAFNAMLDDQLARLQKPGLLHRIVSAEAKRPLSEDQQTKINEHDAMFRRMLSTILITQGFRDLPLETQIHPAVQERMWKHADQFGSMVFEVSDMLANLDATKRKKIQEHLSKRQDLPMVMGEALDARAAAAGLSQKRRMQLRTMMKQTSFRLRNAHPNAVIDEYVGKVERLRASTATDGQAMSLAEQLGEREFWKHQRMWRDTTPTPPAQAAPAATSANPMVGDLTNNARAAAAKGDCRLVTQLGVYVKELDPSYFDASFKTDPALADCMRKFYLESQQGRPPGATPPTSPTPEAVDKPHRGSGGLRVGAYMLGIGLVVFLIAIPITAADFGGVFVGTLGVVIFGIGLLVLLISAIIYLGND